MTINVPGGAKGLARWHEVLDKIGTIEDERWTNATVASTSVVRAEALLAGYGSQWFILDGSGRVLHSRVSASLLPELAARLARQSE